MVLVMLFCSKLLVSGVVEETVLVCVACDVLGEAVAVGFSVGV